MSEQLHLSDNQEQQTGHGIEAVISAVKKVEKAGGISRYSYQEHPLVRGVQSLNALANPESSIRLGYERVGGDEIEVRSRPVIVWSDEDRAYRFDLYHTGPGAVPEQIDFHELRNAVVADSQNRVNEAIAELLNRHGVTAIEQLPTELADAMQTIQSETEAVFAATQQGLETYQNSILHLRQELETLESLLPKLGIDTSSRMLQYYLDQARLAITANYADPTFRRSADRGVTLAGMRAALSEVESELSRELLDTYGETLAEYRVSLAGGIIPVPDEEVTAEPHTLAQDRQLFQARELLRRYRHSEGADPEVIQRLTTTIRRAGGTARDAVSRNTAVYKSYKLGEVERSLQESLEAALIEVRRLNGYEVATPTIFDQLRTDMRGIPVEDTNESPIYSDELELVEQMIRVLELVDQGRVLVGHTNMAPADYLYANIASVIRNFRFAGDRSNTGFHYSKNRRHGRETLAGLVDSFMSEFRAHYPWLKLSYDTWDWTGYPKGKPGRRASDAEAEAHYAAQQRLTTSRVVRNAFDQVIHSAAHPDNFFPQCVGILTAPKPPAAAVVPEVSVPQVVKSEEELAAEAVARAEAAEKWRQEQEAERLENERYYREQAEAAARKKEDALRNSAYGPYRKIRGLTTEELEEKRIELEAKAGRKPAEERDYGDTLLIQAIRDSHGVDIPDAQSLARMKQRIQKIRQDTQNHPYRADIQGELDADEAQLNRLENAWAVQEWYRQIMALDEPAVYIAGNPEREATFEKRIKALLPGNGELPNIEAIKAQVAAIAEEIYSSI